jgi:hypothetical protein
VDDVLLGFSPDDADFFRAMYAEFARRRLAGVTGRRLRFAQPPPQPEQPWGYVVLTPPGGIPAMWEETILGGGTGSGTQGDLSPGSGTGSQADQGDRPGFADCQLYQLMDHTPKGRWLSHPRMEPTGYTIRVYNPSFTAIPQGIFLPVLRDPWGYWWPAGYPEPAGGVGVPQVYNYSHVVGSGGGPATGTINSYSTSTPGLYQIVGEFYATMHTAITPGSEVFWLVSMVPTALGGNLYPSGGYGTQAVGDLSVTSGGTEFVKSMSSNLTWVQYVDLFTGTLTISVNDSPNVDHGTLTGTFTILKLR